MSNELNSPLEAFFGKVRVLAALDAQRRIELIRKGDRRAILASLPTLFCDQDGTLLFRTF